MTTSNRIVSVWDMLKFRLDVFAQSLAKVEEYHQRLDMCAKHFITMRGNAEAIKNVRTSITNVGNIASRLGMPITAHLAEEAVTALETIRVGSFDVHGTEITILRRALRSLIDRVHEEAEGRSAYVLEPLNQALLLQEAPLFGEAVSLKFAKSATDISEAGKCLALDRPTACVFHLMRVAECGVQRLGKKLKVQIDVERTNWYQIVQHINKAVDALPSGTEAERRRKQRFGAAAAHLNAVRIATRNDVMHPKATYTTEEAIDLMDATKQLMQQLAEIV